MKARNVIAIFAAAFGLIIASSTTDAAALSSVTCQVTAVGWRENISALKIDCGGQTYWARESTGNSTCTQKSSMEAIKMWQNAANTSLLTGKFLTLWWETQGGCNTGDRVPREMYLNK